jgi:hypothetical protein
MRNTFTVLIALFITSFSHAVVVGSGPETVTIHCLGAWGSQPFQLDGVFYEDVNRHGSGDLEFAMTTSSSPQRPVIVRSGEGRAIGGGEIRYSDAKASSDGMSIEARFFDASSPFNFSALLINGKSLPMTCQVHYQRVTTPKCTRFCNPHH